MLKTRLQTPQVPGQNPNMIKGQLAFTAQNHCPQVSAAPQKAREICRNETWLAEEVFQHVYARGFRPLQVFGVVFLNQRTKQIEIVGLITGEIIMP